MLWCDMLPDADVLKQARDINMSVMLLYRHLCCRRLVNGMQDAQFQNADPSGKQAAGPRLAGRPPAGLHTLWGVVTGSLTN